MGERLYYGVNIDPNLGSAMLLTNTHNSWQVECEWNVGRGGAVFLNLYIVLYDENF